MERGLGLHFIRAKRGYWNVQNEKKKSGEIGGFHVTSCLKI